MNLPTIDVKLHAVRRAYRAGEALSGEYSIQPAAGQEVRAVELSVLWFTEGKGDEDFGVHFFERHGGHDEGFEVGATRRFETILPNSPLSYEGIILKIRWCVRVRVFLGRGKEFFVEVPFQLGGVPQPALVAT